MSKILECKICKAKMSNLRLPRHLRVKHGIKLDSDSQEDKFNYFMEYVYDGSQNLKCKFCGNRVKMATFSKIYETCASKECITKYSLKGIRTQQIEEIEIYDESQRKLHVKEKLSKGIYSEIRISANRTINKNREIANLGFSDKKFSTMQERILYDFLAERGYRPVVRFTVSRSSGYSLPEGRRMFIFDIYVPSDNLVIEVDGSYHEDKSVKETDLLKQNWAIQNGFKFLRITNDEVDSGKFKELLSIVL